MLLFNDALLFAASEFERQKVLINIINTAVAAGKKESAISTAEKFLENYPHSFISNEIRVRLADLYSETKKPEDALQVYNAVIQDQNASQKLKVKSAAKAAYVYISMKQYGPAAEKFAYVEKNAGNTERTGRRCLLDSRTYVYAGKV